MKRFSLILLAIISLVACTKSDVEELSKPVRDIPQTITVSFEETENTRIELQDDKSVWSQGDIVSVFYKSDGNDCWQFTGQTGERYATLKQISMGQWSRLYDNVIVVYPYNKDYLISLSSNSIEAYLPAQQSYKKDSYGINSSPMIAISNFNKFNLKNVCGWIVVKLTGNGEQVTSIKLRGNKEEQVAGKILIKADDASSILAQSSINLGQSEIGGSLIGDKAVLTSVELKCAEAVTLSAEPTSFYIALPPQTFTKGISVNITCADGSKMVKSTENSITIERNHIRPMEVFAFEAGEGDGGFEEPTVPNGEIPNNEIWYTSSQNRVHHFSNRSIISNTYENGKGVVRLKSDLTYFDDNDINDPEFITSITLPKSLTSLYNGFQKLTSLSAIYGPLATEDSKALVIDGVLVGIARAGITEYTIPNCVTEIDYRAFCEFDTLTTLTVPESVIKFSNYYIFSGCTNLSTFKGPWATEDGSALIVNNRLIKLVPTYSGTSFSIPEGVTAIHTSAIENIASLTSVTIPSTIGYIDDMIIEQCSNLQAVYFSSIIPPIFDTYEPFLGINGSSFNPNINYNICVYDECVDAYKNSNLGLYYQDKIIGYGPMPADITTTITYETTDQTLSNVPSTWIVKRHEYMYGKQAELEIAGKLSYMPASIFKNHYKLRYVTLPATITIIEENAFRDCTALVGINLPSELTEISNYMFSGCKALKTITIPEKVTRIGNSAFEGCVEANITMKNNNVIEIGNKAFYNCKKSYAISFSDKLETIGDQAFYNFASNASYDNNIKSIPASLRSVGSEAFLNCRFPYNVDIHCNVGESWFVKADFNNISFAEGVTTIGKSAFEECKYIYSVHLPESIERLEEQAFYNSKVSVINFPSNLKYIGSRALAFSQIKSVEGLSDNTYIEPYAFACCPNLERFVVPHYWTSVGGFSGCIKLKEIILPPTITHIESSAFNGCTSLTEITIPASVIEIGNSAFLNSGLETVYCLRKMPPGLGAQAFRSYDGEWYDNLDCRIYVPTESWQYYIIAGGWKAYADDIVAYDFE